MNTRADQLEDLVATLDLYTSHHTWTQLTTEQKDLMADVIDARHAHLNAEEATPPGACGAFDPHVRWWRPLSTRDDFDHLRVVSSAAWLVADLARPGVIDVRHDLGIDMRVPIAESVAWWAPMMFAARLIATTGSNPFLAPGPRWTADLPRRWTGRTVAAMPFGALWAARGEGPVHVKPAEVKVASVPAAVHENLDVFLVASSDRLGKDVMIQVSTVAPYEREFRCFTVDRDVVASSVYLAGGVTWDALDPSVDHGRTDALRFARSVLRDPAVAVPDAMALDVGQHVDGTWSVIEANPAWSSNPYHASPVGVIASICAAQRPHASYSRWAWKPDAHLDIARRRPLPTLGA